MKISVVTVCFNSERTIGSTLDSFFAQDHDDKELVVVDGGSTDQTLEIVGRYPRDRIILRTEADEGIYDAMNKGLQLFTGDAVGFLNSDDRFADREALSRIAQAFEQNDVVFGHLNMVSEQKKSVIRRWRSTPFTKGAFMRGWMPAHPTFYVRRPVVEAVGPFNVAYTVAADYDYMLRALELHDFRSALIDTVQIEMRTGGKSTTGLKVYAIANFEALRSRQRWLGAGPVDRALISKPFSKVSQFFTRESEKSNAL
jgi:glycosyltransferase involved in cell wall biosynthesis